jgi:hypothetical protein
MSKSPIAGVIVTVAFNIALAVAPNFSDEQKRAIFPYTIALLIAACIWWLWVYFKTHKTKLDSPHQSVDARDVSGSNIAAAGRDVHQHIYHGAQLPPIESREQRQQRLLLKIIDSASQFRAYGTSSADYSKRTDPIAAFIKFYEEFENEEDVLEMCRLFAASALERHDPFLLLEIYYPGQFKGRRLKFLRDARLSGLKIARDDQALHYVDSRWSAANGFQGRPHSPPDRV